MVETPSSFTTFSINIHNHVDIAVYNVVDNIGKFMMGANLHLFA